MQPSFTDAASALKKAAFPAAAAYERSAMRARRLLSADRTRFTPRLAGRSGFPTATGAACGRAVPDPAG